MAKSAKEIWEALDLELDWSQNHIFVSYARIKELGGEPRLAAKFDQYAALPEVLKKRERFIMPATNGYTLHKGNAYFTFESTLVEKTLEVNAPDLFTFGPGTAEHMHLKYALREGVFNDFFQTQETLTDSWSGRRFITPTSYKFGDLETFDLKSIQIEVDLGLTIGRSEIILVEGKVAKYQDFNARQLFLPYLDAKARIPNIRVTPVFFEVHETGLYTLRSFTFEGNDILTLKPLKTVRYTLDYKDADVDYSFVLNGATDIPQASNPDIILDAVTAISNGLTSNKLIASKLGPNGYSVRQGSYYANACRVLGLARLNLTNVNEWVLTHDGENFTKKSLEDRKRDLAHRIRSLSVVKSFYDEGPDAVLEVLENEGVNTETATRRLSTVKTWAAWAEKTI